MGDCAMTRVTERGREGLRSRKKEPQTGRQLGLFSGTTNAESPRTILELCMVVYVSYPGTREAKARGSKVQGQPL